jgi:ERCC4-related helicase
VFGSSGTELKVMENHVLCCGDRYQMEILREAQKRNTIVYLETGCGKTLIAVLRIRSLAHRLRMPDQKRIAVFLVPTVNLVRQVLQQTHGRIFQDPEIVPCAVQSADQIAYCNWSSTSLFVLISCLTFRTLSLRCRDVVWET